MNHADSEWAWRGLEGPVCQPELRESRSLSSWVAPHCGVTVARVALPHTRHLGDTQGALPGKMFLSSAAVLPAVIILSHNITFSNRPHEPPATGHSCSCNWAVCKWIPLRSVKNFPKIASNGHFLMSSCVCCLFFWISLFFSVGQDGFWTSWTCLS